MPTKCPPLLLTVLKYFAKHVLVHPDLFFQPAITTLSAVTDQWTSDSPEEFFVCYTMASLAVERNVKKKSVVGDGAGGMGIEGQHLPEEGVWKGRGKGEKGGGTRVYP